MIPRTLHQVMLGTPDKQTRRWMRSIEAMNPGFDYRVWTEENVSGLGLEPWQYEHSTAAGASNIIRLHALRQYGGIYCDSDCECLQPLNSLLHHGAFIARQADHVFCNAVMGSEQGHPWITWQIANYGDQRTKDATHGCHLIADSPMDDVTIVPTHLFYSFAHDTPKDQREVHPDAMLVHHWKGSWLDS